MGVKTLKYNRAGRGQEPICGFDRWAKPNASATNCDKKFGYAFFSITWSPFFDCTPCS
jgi:hypothetical protein